MSTAVGGAGGGTIIVNVPGHTPPDESASTNEPITIQITDPQVTQVSVTRRKRNVSNSVQLTVNADTLVTITTT